MHAGLDFGTSNNALSIREADGSVRLLPLEGDSPLLPSAIHTAERELVPLLVLDYLEGATRETYAEARRSDIARARRVLLEEDLVGEQLLSFGSEAFETYMANPGEGYFIKSPKSFLGVTGLATAQLNLFEDLCTLLLGEIRRRGEAAFGDKITSLTVGRPINFLGRSGDRSNQQALAIIRGAAAKIGWQKIDFRLEPAAAGYHYARSLSEPQRVLVADIGGGTSDFSLLELSPDGRSRALAHQGARTGGNDFDIALSIKKIMPAFGMEERNKRGLPLPANLFWQAMSVNDVPAQRDFYSPDTGRDINQLMLDMPASSRFEKFHSIWHQKRSFELVRLAERAKIQLSETDQTTIDVPALNEPLAADRQDLRQASERLLSKIKTLQQDVLANQPTPDAIYTTGGSAQSDMFRDTLGEWLPGVPIIGGHHMDGVASGLALPEL